MSEVDYLNDPLLATPDERPRAERTPLLQRAAEVLDGIEAFVRETGAEPVSAMGRSVRERMLANELAGLRASRRELAGLRDVDGMGLVFGEARVEVGLDDPLLSGGDGIFDVRESLKPKAEPDMVAERRPCPDFDRFRAEFEAVRRSLDEGSRRPQPFLRNPVHGDH